MYLTHFSLNTEPFTLCPNLALYCELPEHQAALTLLQYGLAQGECLMKMTGDVGVGKTLICRKLLSSLGENVMSSYLFNPYLSADQLLAAIAQDMGIKNPGKKQGFELVTVINNALVKHHQLGKKAVVIIDESHLLTDEALEVLRLLTNLETETSKLLHIILVGQPELNDRLNKANLRQINQRISYSYHLNGIDKTQAKKYITRRLLASGHSDGDLFSVAAINALHRASAGIPRVINILCNKALLVCCSESGLQVSKKSMRKAIADSCDLIRTVKSHTKHTIGWGTIALPIIAIVCVSVVIYFGVV